MATTKKAKRRVPSPIRLSRGTRPPPGPVEPPVPGNQLVNPCFNGLHNEDPWGWLQSPGSPWDVSRKSSNPAWDGSQNAVRINDPAQAGEYILGLDARVFQIVSGLGPNLTAGCSGVQHYVEICEMNIYGLDTPESEGVLVWTPFSLPDIAFGSWGPYMQRSLALPVAYPFYAVEFRGKYPTTLGGIKFTNAYFLSA